MIESRTHNIKYTKQVYFIFLASAILWNAAILLAPVFMEIGGVFANISVFIYYFFSPVCHQLDDRSFHIFSYKLGVCSRCTSIYLGFLIAVIFYPIKCKLSNTELPSVWFLLIPVIFIAADAFFDFFGLLANSFFTRSVTGAIAGFMLPFFLIPGFIKLFNDIFNSRSKNLTK
jgi:uncharacterized membrane protein